jgi:hypothetical protein
MKGFTDNTITLVFEGEAEASIRQIAKDRYPLKTGGILIGRYTADNSCACVTEVLPAPPDSSERPDVFTRGIEGLNEILKERWEADDPTYYIGEWHSRPSTIGSELQVEPSAIDIESMIEFAEDGDFQCPEPMLVIMGIATNDNGGPYVKNVTKMTNTKIGVYGFHRGDTDFVTLEPTKTN